MQSLTYILCKIKKICDQKGQPNSGERKLKKSMKTMQNKGIWGGARLANIPFCL
jgi:hypothetical protein